MKYSILIPYYKRVSLKSTLLSYLYHYSDRKDFEIILIEDLRNYEDSACHAQLLNIIEEFKDKLNIKYLFDDLRSYNPSRKYNIGYKIAQGDFLILTSPEIFHERNVLKGLDEEFSKTPDNYIVCSCRAMTFDNQIFDQFEYHIKGAHFKWYQHSAELNRLFHFCSAISKNNYAKIGGFDERYCGGIAYDDDCLVKRIQFNGINIITRDDLITIHIEHDRHHVDNNKDLWNKNGALFTRQCLTNDFFEKFI